MIVRRISHLRYLALAVENYEEELEFLSTSWGLSIAHVDEAHEVTYLGAEGSPEPFSVRLRKGEKRIDLIAYGAHSRSDVDALHAELLQAQVQIVFAPKVLDSPGGGYGFRFYDVDGRTIEVSAEVTLKQNRKINPREPVPIKLSHVVVNSTDMQRTADFYIKHLGFAISDTLMSQKMGNLMHFMRCNNAHHSFAVAQGPHFSLHHASFEMRGVEEWMRGSGKILRSGARMVWGPGRHNAGDNTFAYFLDPAGNTLEYTTELATIDDEDTWHPSRLDVNDVTTQDQWGTANEMNELVARESFNDPDRGLFIAPPV
ncbi:VOC family protein [Glutamicibacter sp.]|uniref:VOC family protein n=1 Tax=Glutamicibacter sp. TaxID=1931995 RepID=UPI002FDF7169